MILYVLFLFVGICQAHHLDHRRGNISQRKNNKGPPPKCSKSFCEQIRLNGMEKPPKNTTWDWDRIPDPPNNNCTYKRDRYRGKVQVGQTIQNEIVYLLTMKKEYCYLMKPNCHPSPGFDYFCWPSMYKVNIITVDQSGVVIDNDVLRDDFVTLDHLEAFNYDDLSCLSC